MFKFWITIVGVFLYFQGFSQELSLEQKAFNYFMENIFPKKYKAKELVFNGKIDKKPSTSYLPTQLECYHDSLRKNSSLIDVEIKQVNLQGFDIKFLKKGGKKQLYPEIYRPLKTPNGYFLIITIYKPYHFVDYYLFLFNQKKEIIKWCSVGEII